VRFSATSLVSNIFVFSLLLSRSRLRLLPRLLATSIFSYIPCFVRQFARKMWPIQLAFLRLTERTMLLPLTTMQHSFISHTIGQADRLQTSPRTPFKTFDVHLISNIFVFSLLSSRSRLRLLPRLLATSIFFYITCFVRQFPRKMWPIQLALLHLTERTVILSMYIWFTSRNAQVTEPYKATISLSRKIHGWTKSPVFEHSSLFVTGTVNCYRRFGRAKCLILQAHSNELVASWNPKCQ